MSPSPSPLAAVCGLSCEVCTIYVGTHHDPARLERLAARFKVAPDQLLCDGCRTERRPARCQQCEFVPCAQRHGVDFCGACPEFPCASLKTFQEALPHRRELWPDQARIGEVGPEQWLAEKRQHHACPQCRTLNSAYDLRCWKCGLEPSCAYVELHRDAVAKHPLAGR
jgi:hypothetical protein